VAFCLFSLAVFYDYLMNFIIPDRPTPANRCSNLLARVCRYLLFLCFLLTSYCVVMVVGRSVGRSVVGRSFGWSVGRSFVRFGSVGRSVGRRSFVRSVGRSVIRSSVSRSSVSRSISRPVGHSVIGRSSEVWHDSVR
jgi:hypothetical protein